MTRLAGNGTRIGGRPYLGDSRLFDFRSGTFQIVRLSLMAADGANYGVGVSRADTGIAGIAAIAWRITPHIAVVTHRDLL
jgi:hypothetical protein